MHKRSVLWLAIAAVMVTAFGAANADFPGRHPRYLHALSDLRAARWLIEHRPGDLVVIAHEDVALAEIDGAIADLKRAAIDDGKNIHSHPPVDAPLAVPGRLHKAIELLQEARSDIEHAEDNPDARWLKRSAFGHIEAALNQTRKALYDLEHH